jgi:ABC-2 type transport system permease protein
MSKIGAVWTKEFRSFWYSPVAYIVITVFLVISSWLFFQGLFLQGNADLSSFFALMPWSFLFLMPALTMRQWAEERKTGTIESLMTLPVREWDVVLGKFLAVVSFLAVILLLTVPLTATVYGLSQNGLDLGVVPSIYLGTLLLGAAYLAIGGWVSSFTENQIVAFILGMALIFMLIIAGLPVVTMFAGPLSSLMDYIGLAGHYQSIGRGEIDTRDLIYYASVIFLFLYLTVRSVESRKWS